MSRVILPGATIGIIGGGQLGRMMAISAKQMGYKIAVLEPSKNGPLAQIADYEINAPYDCEEALIFRSHSQSQFKERPRQFLQVGHTQ